MVVEPLAGAAAADVPDQAYVGLEAVFAGLEVVFPDDAPTGNERMPIATTTATTVDFMILELRMRTSESAATETTGHNDTHEQTPSGTDMGIH